MDDVDHLTGVIEYRRIDGAPKALFESASRGHGPLDVVLLHGHRVGDAIPQDSLERGAHIVHTIGRSVVGIVRENIEYWAPQNILAPSHRGTQIVIARRDYGEVRRQDEIEVGCGFD
ncbi:MAG: hypothetical protein ABSC32_17990 [Steroidobacteraceae bacterium]